MLGRREAMQGRFPESATAVGAGPCHLEDLLRWVGLCLRNACPGTRGKGISPTQGGFPSEALVPPRPWVALPGVRSGVARAAPPIDPRSPRAGREGQGCIQRLEVVGLEGPVSGATAGAGLRL